MLPASSIWSAESKLELIWENVFFRTHNHSDCGLSINFLTSLVNRDYTVHYNKFLFVINSNSVFEIVRNFRMSSWELMINVRDS